MVIEALPVIKAIEKAMGKSKVHKVVKSIKSKPKIIFFSPSGKQLTNTYADKVGKTYSDIILVCGRYEGIDARVKKAFKTDEISVGPFILTGGELPAMIVIDSIARRLPGVLGDINSLEESRIASSDVYTRPENIACQRYCFPAIAPRSTSGKREETRNKSKLIRLSFLANSF
jgi:tRNA (guanine37-N1)-methyltransferase